MCQCLANIRLIPTFLSISQHHNVFGHVSRNSYHVVTDVLPPFNTTPDAIKQDFRWCTSSKMVTIHDFSPWVEIF